MDFITSLLGFVPKSLYDANTILYAVTDDTPVALPVGASTIVGRGATGNIVALTGAETLAILSGQASAAFSFNSQEITNATLNAMVAKGTWTASGTWTIPAVTLAGSLTMGSNFLINTKNISFTANHGLISVADNSYVTLSGGTSTISGVFVAYGKDYISLPGGVSIETTNVAGDDIIARFKITGAAAIAVATWTNVTQTGLNITSGQALQNAGSQVVGARVVDAGIDDVIEAGFTTLYPNASAVLAALQAGIQTHGLITAS